MTSKWPTKEVEELVRSGALAKPLDGNHGAIHPKTSDYVSEGVPFIMASDLEAGRVNLEACSFISEEQANSLRKGFSRVGDVLISRKATIGRTAIVQESEYERIVLTPQVTYYRVLDPKQINAEYLRFYFDSPGFQHLLAVWAGAGSTRAYLGITAQMKLPIVCPPVDTQDAIARAVRPLNDKIELNRRMNQTLEAMAQAIFKSWFVDFEPVKAKAAAKAAEASPAAIERAAMAAIAGRSIEEAIAQEGYFDDLASSNRESLAQTAALFPDAFQASELGEIPEGWEPRTLSNLLELAYGKALKKSDRKPGPYPVYGSGGITGYHNSSIVSGPGIIVGRKGTVGSLYWEDECFFPIDTVFYVLPREGYSLEFLYYLLQTLGLDEMNTDAAVPGLNRNNAYRLEVPAVRVELVSGFSNVISAFRARIRRNTAESRTLAELRDTLLPKLLSGEVTVPEAESQTEEVDV